MDIGLVYSRKDPQQAKVRDFVHDYIRKRGILANVVEKNQPVKSPTLIINGFALKDLRSKPREKHPKMYPSIQDVAKALEQSVWG